MLRRTALAFAAIGLWTGSAAAQDGGASVTACDTLIAARRIDAAAGSGQAAAPEPECRRVPRSQVGAVEQRALIGGAPYECLSVAGTGRCLWIVP
jgi:hypothetical protein